MAFLEDPDHGSEGGGQAEQVEHDRLHRHHDAASHQEQDDERDEGDDAAGNGQLPEQ